MIKTKVKLTHNTNYVSALTGRRRKLCDGAMLSICRAYAAGAKVAELAEQYQVSTHTIYSVVYWTPRDSVSKS